MRIIRKQFPRDNPLVRVVVAFHDPLKIKDAQKWREGYEVTVQMMETGKSPAEAARALAEAQNFLEWRHASDVQGLVHHLRAERARLLRKINESKL